MIQNEVILGIVHYCTALQCHGHIPWLVEILLLLNDVVTCYLALGVGMTPHLELPNHSWFAARRR